MSARLIFLPLLILFVSWASILEVHARPEYTVRHATVSCTACHVSPSGGSLRNINGKNYGANSRGYAFESKKIQENLSLDLRMLYFQTANHSGSRGNRGGLGMMNAAIGGVLPLEEGGGFKSEAVAVYDAGSFQAGPREVYMLWSRGETKLVENIMVGKFVSPFGLLTDEHRTYTRMQTKTSNNDFDMGALVSGRLAFQSVHYDVGVLSGMQSAGALATENTRGAVANLRWVPGFLPFYFGVSGNYYVLNNSTSNYIHDPNAQSAYFVLSLDRLTGSRVNGALQVEVARARYFNSSTTGSQIDRYFTASSAGFASAVANSESLGTYAQLNLDLSPRTTLIYKFDSLALDKNYDGDRFIRHGVGVKHALTRQTFGQFRIEQADVGRTGLGDTTLATQDAYWALLQTWW